MMRKVCKSVLSYMLAVSMLFSSIVGSVSVKAEGTDDAVVTYTQLDNASGTTITDSSEGLSNADKAWDGNTSTFPDLKKNKADGSGTEYDGGAGWTMIRYPQAQRIAKIEFCPRSDKDGQYTSRIIGCSFEASTDGENFVKLGSVDENPTAGVYTTIPVYDNNEYSYVRFCAVAGSYMNVASILVYTYNTVPVAALNTVYTELQELAAVDGSDISGVTAVVDAAVESENPDEIISAYIMVQNEIQKYQMATKYDSFTPDSVWTDTEGVTIQAHGGGVMWDPVSEKYYWYGEHKGTENWSENGSTWNATPVIGTSVYSSTDLYNWKNEGVALPVFNNPEFLDPDATITEDTPMYLEESSDAYQTAFASAKNNTEADGEEFVTYTDYYTFEQYNKHNLDELNSLYDDLTAQEKIDLYGLLSFNMVMERPKVVYNAKNNNYVMWFHLDGQDTGIRIGKYAWADAGVAVSDSPTGPFKYIGKADLTVGKELVSSSSGATDMLRDMTLFVDDDGTGYVLHSNEDNQTLYIDELTDDYTGITGNFSRNFIGISREAPAILKHNGTYYIISSGCSGWAANEGGVASADCLIIDYEDEASEAALQHVGPFQQMNNHLTNFAIGPNSSKTFGGQSTGIFQVQGKEGCFIYMGDRWSAGSLRYSKYHWLPIIIDDENKTLAANWASEWTLDEFDTIASNRKDLNTLIQKCRDIDESLYSSDSVATLNTAISTAEEVTYNADYDTIADAIATLKNVYDELDETDAVAVFNSIEYDSFEDAYDAFVESEATGTITLLQDSEIAYETHTLSYALTVTSNSTGPHTLRVAGQNESADIDALFDVSTSQLELNNVNIDGNSLNAIFAKGDYNLYIVNDVTLSNFTRQIKTGKRMQIEKAAQLTLNNCVTTEDDYLLEMNQYGRSWGTLEVKDSSAKVAVVGYTSSSNSWFKNIISDGKNDCDIHITGGSCSMGVDNTMIVNGNAKVAIADGNSINMNGTPIFSKDSVLKITYGTNGNFYANGTVVVYGNGYITEENMSGFTITNEGYVLELNEDGNLVMKSESETEYAATFGGVGYETFEAAYDAFVAGAADGTITLLKDAVLDYEVHSVTSVGNLTITSDANGPYTLTVADKGDVDTIAKLFDVDKKYLRLVNVNVDGAGLDAYFAQGGYHLQIGGEVTMKNFTRTIKKGNRMTVDSGATLKVVDCAATDNYLFEVYSYAHLTGTVDITNSSAAKAVIGYDWSKNSELADVQSITSDGKNCDLYVSAEYNRIAYAATTYTGTVNVTVANYPLRLFKTPTFADGAVMKITYENPTNGAVVMTSANEGAVTEDLLEHIVLTNEGYRLVMNEEGNLVLRAIVEGDVNDDGVLDIADASAILDVASGVKTVEDNSAYDYDGDGKVTAVDALKLYLTIPTSEE
ncbi:MAG: family 43 glycosylhydrolase [Lachnospiraceae bacterium]